MSVETLMFDRVLHTFLGIGTLTLIFHTFKDFGTGLIDTRSNFLMKGLGLALLLVGGLPLWYILISFLGVFVLSRFFTMFKSGDYSTFLWISILGFFYPFLLFLFVVLFLFQYGVISLFLRALQKVGLKRGDSFPAHLIILTSFIIFLLELYRIPI
jgi:hypothetical protein